jgi:murein DD-endopeptidase MepM/ murein hydrolase activator NlpD
MIPLLLTAGRMLATGAVRGAVAGGTRGAITQSVKKVAVDAAKKKAGGLAKSFIKKKITNAKKVSAEKLVPRAKKGGGGGGLVRKKSSAIVKRPTSALQKNADKERGEEKQNQEESKPFNGDELIQELISIKETLVKIRGSFGSNLANTLKNQRNQTILRSKQKSSEKESELEKKPERKDDDKKIKTPKKKPSFLEMIWNFISNVFMGTLINFLLNYVPQIIKMFEDISKGLTNTWQVLRLGIITLTTLFPKQIKFLAKLTAKIIGPPAKLIGKLLLKAGSVAGFLFKKAGGIVLNLIKGPLLNLIKKVGGEALEQGVKGAAKGAASIVQSITKKGAAKVATRASIAAGGKGAAKALGSSAKLLNRLKIFSKIFKRVPIVGALIGLGIDLAMGESLGRAAAGAAGAAVGAGIGSWLGGLGAGALGASTLGVGLLAAPFIIGAAGFIGSAAGDYLGKAIYDQMLPSTKSAEKAAPVEKMYAAGRVGGGSRTMPSRNSSVQGKPSIATSKISPEVENKAKEGVLKDEKSLERFKSLSSIFAGTPFVGQLLKLGIDIGMGGKVQRTQTDIAAQELGFTIGRAMEDNEFSVPGLNKRIIGPLSKNLTEWAKKKIFYEVKSREGLFPSIEKGEEEENERPGGPGGPDDGGGGGGGGGVLPGDAPPEVKAMLEAIAGGEGSWDSVNPSTTVPGLSGMTIADAKAAAIQKGVREKGGSGAMGKWQQMPDFIIGRAKSAGLNPDKDKFSHENQTKIARMLMASVYPGGEAQLVKDAQKDPLKAAANLRGTWPSLPGGSQENAHSRGFLARYNQNVEKYQKIASSGGGGGQNEPNVSQKGKKIFLHWTAGGYNDNPSQFGYNSVFDGSGNKHQIRPYNVTGEHTWHRNKNSVGLAVAAMGGKTDPWSVPPKAGQIESMTAEAGKIAKSWGWKASDINKNNVMTHAEIAKIDGYGPGSGDEEMRWDFLQTAKGKPDWSGGDELRQKIKSGMGGGFGFNHHLLPKFAMGGGGHSVTSDMGMRNLAISPGMHMGIDIAGTKGEKLQAFTDGTVEATSPPSPSAGYGNWVSWIDNKGIGHLYGHMNKPPSVKAGQEVKKGTILGELGETGNTTGPHLHWEAATNPQDTGRPKNAVLSRFNPLSKYNKEAPFGGTIAPDGSIPSSDVASTATGTPRQDGESGESGATLDFTSNIIRGDAAVGGMGGGTGIDLWGISPSSNQKLNQNSSFNDVPPHHRSYTTEAGVPRDYAVVKSGVDPVANPSAGKGENVVAGVTGKVTYAGFAGGAGNHVEISSGNKKIIRLLHLDKIKASVGQNVSPSSIIGTQGNSGTKDVHVHVDGSQAVHANWIKAMLGGEYQANPNTSTDTDTPATPGSRETEDEQPELQLDFTSHIIRGDPAIESVTEAIKHKPSYDQGGQQSIVMMPIPQGSSGQQVNPTGGIPRSMPMVSSGLNSKEVAARSVNQFYAAALYKM